MKAQKRSRAETSSPSIAIIMPVYNEGSTVSKTVLEIYENIIKKVPGTRLLAFEDGSMDNTKEELKRLAKKYKWLEIHLGQERRGYPGAFKNAFASIDESKFDYIMTTDSDGQNNPEYFPKLLSTMEKSNVDMVIAERRWRVEPLYRVILSNGLRAIEHTMFNIPYNDVTSSFRLMKPGIGKQIAKEVKFSRYNFWSEFSARASMKNVTTAAFVVEYRKRGTAQRPAYMSGRKLPKIIANEFSALVNTRFEKQC